MGIYKIVVTAKFVAVFLRYIGVDIPVLPTLILVSPVIHDDILF